MLRMQTAAIIFSGLVLCASALAQQAPPIPKGSAAMPTQPLPDEFKKLQPLVGEWDSEVYPSGALDDKSLKAKKTRGKMTIQWILDGRYLHIATENGKDRFIWIIGYDSVKKKYRRFTFTNAGQTYESFGEWNGEFQSIDWTTPSTRLAQDFIGIDQVALGKGKELLQVSIMETDAKGKLYQKMASYSTRRK